MSIDFTAIDFETANGKRASVCSVGMVKVRGGEVVTSLTSLVRPPESVAEFLPYNTRIHGITATMVAESPTWDVFFPSFVNFAGADPLIAHNANFDLSVLRGACAAVGIESPHYESICTLALSRRLFELPSYRLPFVAGACAVDLLQHHDAGHDATAAALIAIAMAHKIGCADVWGLRSCLEYEDRISGRGAETNFGPNLAFPSRNLDAVIHHPLYGREVVFTGTLTTMTRQDAWNALSQVGGIPGKSVTKRTNVLVVGDLDATLFAPGQVLSGKARKAFELQDKGQDIELMTEVDFLHQI